jgi:hypothetical protein
MAEKDKGKNKGNKGSANRNITVRASMGPPPPGGNAGYDSGGNTGRYNDPISQMANQYHLQEQARQADLARRQRELADWANTLPQPVHGPIGSHQSGARYNPSPPTSDPRNAQFLQQLWGAGQKGSMTDLITGALSGGAVRSPAPPPMAPAADASGDSQSEPGGTFSALRKFADFAARNPAEVIKELMDTGGIEAAVQGIIDKEVGRLSAAAGAVRGMQEAALPQLVQTINGAQAQTQQTLQELRAQQQTALGNAQGDEARRAELYANTPGLEGIPPQTSNMRAAANATAGENRYAEAAARGADHVAAAESERGRYAATAAATAGGFEAAQGAARAQAGALREEYTRKARDEAMKMYELQSNQLSQLAQIESANTKAADGSTDPGEQIGWDTQAKESGKEMGERFLTYVKNKTKSRGSPGGADIAGRAEEAAKAGWSEENPEQAQDLAVLRTMIQTFDSTKGTREQRIAEAVRRGGSAGIAVGSPSWRTGSHFFLEGMQSVLGDQAVSGSGGVASVLATIERNRPGGRPSRPQRAGAGSYIPPAGGMGLPEDYPSNWDSMSKRKQDAWLRSHGRG